MKIEIITAPERKLIGLSASMSFSDFAVGALWQRFGPRIPEIVGAVGNYKVSMALYADDFYYRFSPMNSFEKWAAVEVESLDKVPDGLQTFIVPAGTYAVFHYKGSSADTAVFQYIHSEWLRTSAYDLDDRPHLEVLGDGYKGNHPDSEEQIWIPIVLKNKR